MSTHLSSLAPRPFTGSTFITGLHEFQGHDTQFQQKHSAGKPQMFTLRFSELNKEINLMEYSINPISKEDHESIADIFNYYVENSFAAYPENKVPLQAIDLFMEKAADLPTGSIKDQEGRVVGFGMLRIHNPWPTFSHTAEIAYFIHPDHTGKGLGKRLLGFLEKGAAKRGITNILAHVSSLNPRSIEFHKQNGFAECGRFHRVGKKRGQEFDTVWMQKML